MAKNCIHLPLFMGVMCGQNQFYMSRHGEQNPAKKCRETYAERPNQSSSIYLGLF